MWHTEFEGKCTISNIRDIIIVAESIVLLLYTNLLHMQVLGHSQACMHGIEASSVQGFAATMSQCILHVVTDENLNT